jgi:hypothetical protein
VRIGAGEMTGERNTWRQKDIARVLREKKRTQKEKIRTVKKRIRKD